MVGLFVQGFTTLYVTRCICRMDRKRLVMY